MESEELAEAVMERFEAWNLQDQEFAQVLAEIAKGEM